MPLGPRMSRISSPGAGGVEGAESAAGADAEPGAEAEPVPDAGGVAVTRAGMDDGATSGPCARAGARCGRDKRSGVVEGRVGGGGGALCPKDGVPAASAARPTATAAHAGEARLFVQGLIRGGVHGF